MRGRHGVPSSRGRALRPAVGVAVLVVGLLAAGGCGGTSDEPVVPSLAVIEAGLARSVNAANPVETACVAEQGAVGEYTCVMGPFRLDTSVRCDAALCTWEFMPPPTPDSPPRRVTGSFRVE